MIKVFLHGYLKKLYDGPIEVAVSSPAEAIKAVFSQISQLRPSFRQGGKHRIAVVGCDTLEDLLLPVKGDELHIVPQLNGGKLGAFLQILIGAVLIVAGIFLYAYSPFLGSMLIQMGAMLILGGIMQLLAPKPQTDRGEEQKKSQYLGTPKNTVAIGTRIPILYGKHRVYGHFLSFDITAMEVAG